MSPTETFLNMAHYLLRSLRLRGGYYRDAPLILTVGARERDLDLLDRHRWLSEEGVVVRWVDPELFASESWYATACERFRHDFASDVVLLLDADVLVAGPLDELVEQAQRTGALCGVVAHVPPLPTREAWEAIYHACGLGELRTPCEHTGWGYMFADESLRFCPPYFNLGVLAVPAAVARRIGGAIYELMTAVDSVHRTSYRVQLAVSLAVTRYGLPFQELPFRWNFVNDPLLEAIHAAELGDVRIIHLLRRHQVDKNQLYASLESVEAMLARRDLRVVNALAQQLLAEIHPGVRAAIADREQRPV